MSGPEVVFALAPGQNAFFRELAETLTVEIEALGGRARVQAEGMPEMGPGVVPVLLPPHEFVALAGVRPSPRVLGRCALLSAEQPSSGHFDANVSLGAEAGAVLDINKRAVDAYAAAGIEAEHLQVGYSPAWDKRDAVAERDIDVLFMGRASPRRERALAGYADVLERLRCRIHLSDNSTANPEEGVDFATGEAKLRLLARSKVLLNVHGEEEPYFEWLRVAEAMSAGCAVVSEYSSGAEPLRPGTDLVFGRLEALGLLAGWLAEDGEARARMVGSAESRLRKRAMLADGARALLRAAERIDDAATSSEGLRRSARTASLRMDLREPPPEPRPVPGEPIATELHPILRALKRQHGEILSLRRRMAADALAHSRPESPEPEMVEVVRSPAWRTAPVPQVSVVVPLYNDRDVVCEALESVLGATVVSTEVVVIDDGSSDGGGDAVREWIDAHPDHRAALYRHEINMGLPTARNTGIERSRAGLILMLDSDNLVRRLGMERLALALERDPDASFAYGMLDRFMAGERVGMLSNFGWDPERLRGGNYIDALAMFRRSALEEMDGYSEDLRLYGYEDYDLWARLAEAGHRGAFVRRFVASYRVGHSSMISVTDISATDAVAAIAEHAPTLMRDIEMPA